MRVYEQIIALPPAGIGGIGGLSPAAVVATAGSI
jgi:hypothetical protein